MQKFSANLGFLWPDRPVSDRVVAAAAAGFRAVEFHWPYDVPAASLRRTCREVGVEALALNTPPGDMQAGEYGLGALPGREADFFAGFDRACDYAREIGARFVHVMAGVPREADGERARATLADNLRLAAERAHDLVLLLEPLNARDRPGYFFSTAEKVAATIDQVGAANLRMMFDVYHVAIAQGDVLTRLERYLPTIGHVQIAAVPSRAEPDQGEIAYGAIFSALDRLGYRGWIGCEYRPQESTDEGLRWLETFGMSLRNDTTA
ncbi:MAG: TIM barrel protein [Pseudomonadota bacterium]